MLLVARSTDGHRHLFRSPCWSGSNQATVVVSVRNEAPRSLRAVVSDQLPTPLAPFEDASTSAQQFQGRIWRDRKQAEEQSGVPASRAELTDNRLPIHNCDRSGPSGCRLKLPSRC